MNYTLIPGHVYYVKLSNKIEFIFEYVKISKGDIVVSTPRYYHVGFGIKYSPYAEEGGLCRLFCMGSLKELRGATSEEAKLLGVENYSPKLKINHKQFKLKFTL